MSRGPKFKAAEAKDFAGALNYLSLTSSDRRAARYVSAFRRAKMVRRAAKDILRASGLPLLPRDTARVAVDLKKIRVGKALSPVLLVRGDLVRGLPLIIADGYHRTCALYYYAPETMVPCLLVAR
ncbi:MAG: hypothetical protein JO167_03200 [Alphaproteobacteria bacterium]|nr:hypothetical protein [Alphaproteobacteria bacterium]MBV9905795.1 hypothetical protein [Alphaproteobacteria bacterium]